MEDEGQGRTGIRNLGQVNDLTVNIENVSNTEENDNDLIIDHNLGDLFYKNVFGRLYLCTNHSAMRRYYIMRNYLQDHKL